MSPKTPAIASVQNPLNKDEILIFYQTKDNQLGLFKREGNSDSVYSEVAVLTLEEIQYIKEGSSLAAITLKDVITVYGIATDNRISLFYPNPSISSQSTLSTNFGSLGASSDGQDSWLYYLKADDAGAPWIKEHAFADFPVSPIIPRPSDNLLHPETCLATFCNPKNSDRNVIYQEEDNIHIVNVRDSSNSDVIKINTKKRVPFAVSAVLHDNELFAYLYFVDGENRLQRIVRNPSGEWDPPTLLDAPVFPDGVQLSVTPNADNSANYVFYVNGDYEIKEYCDKL